MTIEQLRFMYDQRPFQPFILHLADGRSIPVQHREFIASAPNGRTLAIFQPDSSMNIIDLLLVTDIEVRSPQVEAIATAQ